MEGTWEKLQDVFREVFQRYDLEINKSMTMADIEGWDSFVQVTLIVNIERAFDFQFESSELTSFKCIGDIFTTIESKLTH